MHTFAAVMGVAMLVLVGVAVVLGLVMLVLYEVRCIVRGSREIGGQEEPTHRQHFPDVPPQHLFDNYWQN